MEYSYFNLYINQIFWQAHSAENIIKFLNEEFGLNGKNLGNGGDEFRLCDAINEQNDFVLFNTTYKVILLSDVT